MKRLTLVLSLLMGIFALAKAQPGELVPDDGVTSPVHEKYMGKFVFSSQVVPKDNAQESSFTNSFTLGSPMYFRVFMKQSLANALGQYSSERIYIRAAKGFYDFIIVLDGKYTSNLTFAFDYFAKGEKKEWTTFRGILKEKGEPEYGSLGYKEFNQFLAEQQSHLSPGEHTLHFELKPNMLSNNFENVTPIATGDLKMTVTGSVVDKNDPNMCLPTAQQSNLSLENKVLAAFKEKGWREQAQKAVLMQGNWTIVKNQLTSVPIRRTMAAAVATTQNGECAYQIFDFAQDYTGSGYSDYLYLHGTGDKKNIPCDCLK